MMIFKHRDVSFIHAPKVGSRTILGLFSILKKPNLHIDHPEYFKEVNQEDHVYSPIRLMQTMTEEIETPISFVVRRDPVKRFISAYKNRVITHRELGDDYPDFDKFIANFEEYYAVGTINTHFAPLTRYYGDDSSKFTHFFRTDELYKLKEFLENHFDRQLPDLHLQQNVPFTLNPTKDQIRFIKDFYKADYKNGWN